MPAERPQPKIRAIECPNCGGAVELRGMGSSLHATCTHCMAVLDVSHPAIQIAQTFQKNIERFQPKIPLGSRGKLEGKLYEVIGFQTRAILADGQRYTWDEYVLYNPFYGFRYLSEYDGHWNDILPLSRLPQPDSAMGQSAVRLDGRKYRLFQSADAKTVGVLGEFPWRVKVGDSVAVADYIDPPGSVSREGTVGEYTWSQSRYVNASEIWQAFQLKTTPPPVKGVYSNQPNPSGSTAGMWKMMFVFSALLLVAMIVTYVLAGDKKVFESKYTFVAGSGEPSFVTETFQLAGGNKNVEVDIRTDLENDWAFFGLALINDETGTAYDFGKEVSYYHGSDSDGSWSEGDRKDSVRIGGVPGGRYYLRVEPEMEKSAVSSVFGGKRMNYQLTVLRDVPVLWPFFVAWPFLLIPPVYALIRRAQFESKRWAEADPTGSAAAGEDDDE
ncbi:DUF4178 domain-containing protein [Bryobacter aggregatus]|uniref:DUF4178 domain-containing protein n=1 Tax=Bryobacter aggregatus TaxID=360054 RepID=UPI0004E164DE|nr:DUF4178 domain-containing protein [Bryobacter aggregatus]